MQNHIHFGPCSCSKWENNMDHLIDVIHYCNGRVGAPKYTSPEFRYCPWCGKERPTEKVYSSKYDSFFNPATSQWIEEYNLWWKKKAGDRPETAIDEEIPLGD